MTLKFPHSSRIHFIDLRSQNHLQRTRVTDFSPTKPHD